MLIDGTGRVRVTDFGLASDPGAEAAGGTPAYMAPEVHQGQASDARADQFSFCVALYEGLTGERPFAGVAQTGLPSEVAVGLDIVQGRARPPGRAMPRSLWRVLERGLSPSPEDRFPSMAALLDELERRAQAGRRRLGAALALALAGALGVAVVLPRRAASTPSCASAAETRLGTAWSPARRSAAATAIAALKLPFGDESWAASARVLDAYASSWRDQRTAACQATRAGEQSAEVLDLRMWCLDQRLRELDALVGMYEHPNAKLVRKGAQAAAGLSALADCADVPALREPLRRPTDPKAAAEIDRAFGELARAQAMMSAGDYAGGLAVARAIAASPAAAGYAPLLADALYRRGNLETKTGDDHAADATLRDALIAADAGHDDLTRVRAALNLVWVTGVRLERHAEGHWFAREALAAAARAGHGGPDDALRGDVLFAEASVFDDERKQDEALDANRKALAIRERVQGKDSPEIAEVLINIGVGLINAQRSAEAEAPLRRAVAIYDRTIGHTHPLTAIALVNLGSVAYHQGHLEDALAFYGESLAIKEKLLGPEHPDLAFVLNNLGDVAYDQHHLDDALVYARRAASLWEKAYGPDYALLAYPLTGEGKALVALGRSAEAVALLEHALAIREHHSVTGADLGETCFALAKAILPADRARARALAGRASAAFAADSKERVEVDAWIAAGVW